MKTATERDAYATGLRLWNEWTEMWNGRPELALDLVAERFCLHLPSPSAYPEEAVNTPKAVEAWVRQHRAKFEALTFHTTCGPFVDVTAGIVAGPWFADIVLNGARKSVCGMDTIAFRNGPSRGFEITEYWTLSKDVDVVGKWGNAVYVPSSKGSPE